MIAKLCFNFVLKVWFFNRSNLTSHLKGLALNASTTKPKQASPTPKQSGIEDTAIPQEDEVNEYIMHSSWDQADYRNVVVKCKWDNSNFFKFREQFGAPLFVQWLEIQKQQSEVQKTKETKPDNEGDNETETDAVSAASPAQQQIKNDLER